MRVRYKVSLENLFSDHVASPWLPSQPSLVVTHEDGVSWWLAEDFFVCTGASEIEVVNVFSDDYLAQKEEELPNYDPK